MQRWSHTSMRFCQHSCTVHARQACSGCLPMVQQRILSDYKAQGSWLTARVQWAHRAVFYKEIKEIKEIKELMLRNRAAKTRHTAAELKGARIRTSDSLARCAAMRHCSSFPRRRESSTQSTNGAPVAALPRGFRREGLNACILVSTKLLQWSPIYRFQMAYLSR